MGIASVLLGIASLLMLFGGIFFSVVPFLGALLSFGSPIVALVAVIVGGLGLKQGKDRNEPTGAATAGIIVGVISIIPGIIVALTCGLCNAAFSGDMSNGGKDSFAADFQDVMDKAAKQAQKQQQAQRNGKQPPVPPLPAGFGMSEYSKAIQSLSNSVRSQCKTKEQIGVYVTLEESIDPDTGKLMQKVSSVSLHTLIAAGEPGDSDPTKVKIEIDASGTSLGAKTEDECIESLARNLIISPAPTGPSSDHLAFAVPAKETIEETDEDTKDEVTTP